jgi:hypothetical protein
VPDAAGATENQHPLPGTRAALTDNGGVGSQSRHGKRSSFEMRDASRLRDELCFGYHRIFGKGATTESMCATEDRVAAPEAANSWT